jgi:hypothetical protein
MGQKRAAYDDAGTITAFYDDSISPAPQGVATIPLTTDQWQACLSSQGGYIVQNGALVNAPTATAAELLAAAKAAKVAELTAVCRAAILAGFMSSALGAPYSYPAKDTDQQNLNASVVASLLPGLADDWATPFWCADAQGVWAFRMHTVAQIQQVGKDGKAAIVAAMVKNQALADQVAAATTVADVEAIAWA